MKKPYFRLGAVLTVTIIFGTIYATVQQSLRLSANDPQIQIAEDMAAQLDSDRQLPASPDRKVDVTKSLAPFYAIYNKAGRLVSSNTDLGNIPAVPVGVLQRAAGREYNVVTWQPTDKLRFAAVTVASQQYYVLSARSLREVEKREDRTMLLASLGWLASLVVLAASVWLRQASKPRKT